MKKSLLATLACLLLLSSAVEAKKGNKPCSGKKGGISHCTTSGKFVCHDGSISKSKRKCSGHGKKSSVLDFLDPAAG